LHYIPIASRRENKKVGVEMQNHGGWGASRMNNKARTGRDKDPPTSPRLLNIAQSDDTSP
jgi:hypothetical protein